MYSGINERRWKHEFHVSWNKTWETQVITALNFGRHASPKKCFMQNKSSGLPIQLVNLLVRFLFSSVSGGPSKYSSNHFIIFNLCYRLPFLWTTNDLRFIDWILLKVKLVAYEHPAWFHSQLNHLVLCCCLEYGLAKLLRFLLFYRSCVAENII